MVAPPAEDLIYAPAKRRGIGLLLMIAGISGAGKTLSALRLATGLANGGPIGFCDTEHGRALAYADDFNFLHLELKEPFNPARFEAAINISQRQKHAVLVIDSFSHEHVGPGGVLDMFEDNLQRMTKGDFEKREQLKYTAWIAPKQEHKHLMQRMWQLNMHIILCCQAEKKLDLIKNNKGKMVPNPDALQTPICSPDIPYAMTASLLLNDIKRPGVPVWLKRFEKFDPLIPMNRVLDEETGRRLGIWASGAAAPEPDSVPASKPGLTRPAVSAPPPADAHQQSSQPVPGPPDEDAPPPGQSPEQPSLAGLPLDERRPAERTPSKKNLEVLEGLIRQFEAVRERADHLAIIDDKTQRDRIDWFKKNKPEMFARLDAAAKASWARTMTRNQEAVE